MDKPCSTKKLNFSMHFQAILDDLSTSDIEAQKKLKKKKNEAKKILSLGRKFASNCSWVVMILCKGLFCVTVP